ncbi:MULTISPECIES: FemAB family XrtA/PEP-CTERM system-associated protein [unclassified Roseateles]|uniref:FemAB family XrtA/PEP-CTERM system-associated protein n=1 Tax=unclassified Roseateles TaxID=2626991 RepID=UPI0006FBB877|nr:MULTISPECIES: FemAB family XrtA/PEP-CTERM system-associated protein [unclassified Roseateles]KQW43203.1 peptidoglycan bridge formation protein FemAB [Pelomonas sp. Root405]KRA70941.1 peptidoglycan bridge formation protein FemAB [Pelomonas sp. Root662]
MSAPLRIARLAAQDKAVSARWDAFVFAHPLATFFHRSGWLRVIETVFGHRGFFLYAERDGVIEGVLPLAEVKSRLFGHAVTSLPFAVYGGVAALNDEAAAALEAEAEKIARGQGAEHLEYRNLGPTRHVDWPRQNLYVTFRKEILADEEANMLAIPRKQRAMVRKGIKNELKAEVDANVDRFFDLYADNVHRHGTPAMPKKYFQSLLDEFGADAEVLTVTAPSGKPLSTVLSFYFRDEVLPYYAGDDEAARDLAANDFKYWELMRRACARGLKVFDYGRSKQGTGPYAFKKNWGFEPQPLSYEYRLFKRDAIPQNNPNNPKYQLMIKAWRKLPIGVANWLGPFIVKSLG